MRKRTFESLNVAMPLKIYLAWTDWPVCRARMWPLRTPMHIMSPAIKQQLRWSYFGFLQHFCVKYTDRRRGNRQYCYSNS
jgi:hypothetical protein